MLLLKGRGFVKTVKFDNPKYLGDPINIVRIFNEKEVPEMVVLDINATREGRDPNYDFLSNIAGDCFMPLSYGGGLSRLDQIIKVLSIGFEKVVLNAASVENPGLIKEASDLFGSQSIVVCMDIRKSMFGKHEVYIRNGGTATKMNPVDHAKNVERMGAGEIIVNSIDRDGTMIGYDVDLISKVSRNVSIPVLASGGAGNLDHFREAVETGGASALVAGSMFVFHGKHRAVLINYPETNILKNYLR